MADPREEALEALLAKWGAEIARVAAALDALALASARAERATVGLAVRLAALLPPRETPG